MSTGSHLDSSLERRLTFLVERGGWEERENADRKRILHLQRTGARPSQQTLKLFDHLGASIPFGVIHCGGRETPF